MIFSKEVTDMIDMNIEFMSIGLEDNINVKLLTLINDNINHKIFNDIKLFVRSGVMLYQLDNDNEIN